MPAPAGADPRRADGERGGPGCLRRSAFRRVPPRGRTAPVPATIESPPSETVVAQEANEESSRRGFPLDSLPGLKCPPCDLDQVLGGTLGEHLREIVIGFVPSLLEVQERLCNPPQIRRHPLGADPVGEMVRQRGAGEGPRRVLHLRVFEGAGDEQLQALMGAAGEEGRSFVDQEVEKGVVGSRDSAPETGLTRFPSLLADQVLCLDQQIGVEAHATP